MRSTRGLSPRRPNPTSDICHITVTARTFDSGAYRHAHTRSYSFFVATTVGHTMNGLVMVVYMWMKGTMVAVR